MFLTAGLMKSRDVTNEGYIHTSDFRAVINEYGFEMGNKLIQSILVKCNIDTQGNIKYSPLEKALNDERNILLSQKDSQYQLPSSQGFSQAPVRADQAHKDKIRSEANLTNLQSNRADIQQMYTKYVNGTCSEEEFKSLIEGFGISLKVFPWDSVETLKAHIAAARPEIKAEDMWLRTHTGDMAPGARLHECGVRRGWNVVES